jgi:Domain of unknown function (DUF4402)
MRLTKNIISAGLFLMWAGETSSAEAAAISQSTARAAIVSPLSLIKTSDLLFGDIASSSTAGTVTVDATTGTRTATGGVTLLGGTVHPASFTGVASGLNLVVIQSPATPVTLTQVGGAQTMRITSFTIQGGTLRLFLTRQAFDFNVGGTLAVNANQADGVYQGTFPVTINYF